MNNSQKQQALEPHNASEQPAPAAQRTRKQPLPKARQRPQSSPEKQKPQFNQAKEIKNLAEEFESCRKILQALGDENRQHLIIEMVKIGKCGGVRVGEITQRTHLSRPTVSHHLHILKDAGIVKVRREGTKNYYYFDDDARALESLMRMLVRAQGIMRSLPDRSICRNCSNLTGCEFCNAFSSGASQAHDEQQRTSQARNKHPNTSQPSAANPQAPANTPHSPAL